MTIAKKAQITSQSNMITGLDGVMASFLRALPALIGNRVTVRPDPVARDGARLHPLLLYQMEATEEADIAL